MSGRPSADEVASRIREAFPGVRVTSAVRTRAQQDALVAAGKTRAKNSQYVSGTALDLVLPDTVKPAQIRTFLRVNGLDPSEFLQETGRGRNQGTGAHLHVGWGAKARGSKPTVAAAPARSGSTFDRVRAARQADASPSLSDVHRAYRGGRMTSDEAAQYERDVDAGRIMLPSGEKLNRQPAAPQLPAGVVKAFNDMESGMTIEQRREVEADLDAGRVSLPRGAQLNTWRPMTFGEDVKRQLGLGTRAVIEGIGDVGGLIMNPVNSLINATGLPEKLTGAPLPMANDPSVNIADGLGLPRPQFDSERIINQIERGATGALATLGGGVAASQAPGIVGTIGRALTAAPVADVVSGGVAGGASEFARQEGAGPIGQLAAGLLSGTAAYTGVAGVARGVNRKPAAQLASETPKEIALDRAGELTEEAQELALRNGVSVEELKQAYTQPERVNAPLPLREAGADTPPVRSDPTIAAPEPAPSLVAGRSNDTVEVPVAVPASAGSQVPSGLAAVSPKDPSLPATAVERVKEAEEVGIPLTRGQAAQDFAIQDTEQTLRAQASGEGEKAREFIVRQAQAIKDATQRFRDSFGSTEMNRTERGQLVKDALRDLRDAGKAGINALYREAQELGGDTVNLDVAPIVDAAKRVLIEADVPDPVKNVVRQEMARYGMIGRNAVTAEDGLTTVTLADKRKVQFYGDPQTLNVANAEDFRKAISAQYTADGPLKLSQRVKSAVDDAVEDAIASAVDQQSTGPVGATLKRARQAVVDQKATFNARDLVQRLIDWKKGTKTDVVLPEGAVREILGSEMSNLRRVKATLLSKPTEQSRAAWRAIQAEGVGQLFDKAYTINSNFGGGMLGSVSGAKLNSEIAKIGAPKLQVLLEPNEFKELMKLSRVIGNATIPIAGTTNPSGSAFKMMRFLMPMAARFSGVPLLGPIAEVAGSVAKQARDTARAKRTLAGMTEYDASRARADNQSRNASTAATASDPADPRGGPDVAVSRFIEALVEAARAGRLFPAIMASQPDDEALPEAVRP